MGVRSLRSSFSLSVILHLLFLMMCGVLITQRAANPPASRVTWIEVDPLTQKEKDKLKREDERVQKRIVQTDLGDLTQKAAPDAFLGEHTQTVDRQTVSKTRLTEMEHKQPVIAAKPQSQNQAQAQATAQPKRSALADLGVRIIPKTESPRTAQQAEDRDRRWADFGNLPADYVKGMKESERTALNTKEFVFYGYFQRIRERLDRAWVPILRSRLLKMYYGGRQLASDMDHTTKVKVVLNHVGEIIRVQVLSESGNHDLDDAAVSAFNQAGPFPNPPSGIAGGDGLIEIPWEFILRT